MKKVSLLLLFITVILQAQIDTIWTKSFDGYPYEVYDEAYSVKPTTDGGFIITGQTQGTASNNAKLWLIKTDSEGNEEWNSYWHGRIC